jgi:signal transduction histidine kinase
VRPTIEVVPLEAPTVLEYADDRPWPGATAWSDAVSRSALGAMAGAVEHLTGYRISCVNVVHRGALRAVAVHGPPALQDLVMDSQVPVPAMEAELAAGDVLGRFVSVPAGRFDRADDYGASTAEYGATFDDCPDLDASSGVGTVDPDRWHVDDLMCAPFRDADGAMIGLLSVDLPVDGRRPGPTVLERLDRYAEMVEVAVRMALQHDEQRERIAMSSMAREVVAAATRQLSLQGVVSETAELLAEGFAARGVWLQLFDEEASAGGAGRALTFALTEAEVTRAEEVARRAWATSTVGVLSETAPRAGERSEVFGEQVAPMLDTLRRHEAGSAVLVPIGAGERCLGWMALSRGPAGERWTPVETETARDIGRDLGRAVLNTRAYAREQAAVAELQALDTYKSQLVATLSHELKTPLTSVLGNLELLEEGEVTPDDTRRSLSAIGRGTQRLVRVVDDLMLLAKVGDPGNHLITRPVDLCEVVVDIVEMTAASAMRSGIRVDVALPPGPVWALGDADELDRVVSNLVSNALKYTPREGHVRLAVERELDEVLLTCADDGIGISEVDRARLFREFFRSPDPAAQRLPGSGLGLAITDRIVSRHGGRIDVTSEVGRGATFQVRLPGWTPPPGTGPAGSTGG